MNSLFSLDTEKVFELLIAALVGSTIIMGLAMLAVAWMNRQSAAARFMVWQSAFVLNLLLIPAVLMLPKVPLGFWGPPSANRMVSVTPSTELVAQRFGKPQLQIENSGSQAGAGHETVPLLLAEDHAGLAGRPGGNGVVNDLVVSRAGVPFWPMMKRLLVAVWIGVATVLLIRLAVSHCRVTRFNAMSANGSSAIGTVPIAWSEFVDVPVTTGIFSPMILLPYSAREWTTSRRDMVLSHELAHVDRRDVLWQLVASVSRSLFWFQPLAWWAHREMVLEREQACDDYVLRDGASPEEYASELLTIATLIRNGEPGMAGVVSMIQEPLERRIRNILAKNVSRRLPGSLSRMMVWGSFALISTLVSTLQPFESPKASSEPVAERASNFELQEAQQDDEKTIELPAEIWGRVVDQAGQPVADARVAISLVAFQDGIRQRVQPPLDVEVTTDEEGVFDFKSGDRTHAPADGVFIGLVTREGFVNARVWLSLKQIKDGQLDDLVLEQGRMVKGRLVAPPSKDGTVRDVPMNAQVRVVRPQIDEKQRYLDYTITCVEDGSFQFYAPTGDGVKLLLTADNYAVSRLRLRQPNPGNSRRKKLDNKDDAVEFIEQDLGELNLDAGTSVSGRVVDQDGNPVSEVAVEICEQKSESLESGLALQVSSAVMTDREGRFRLPPHLGDCTVTVVASGRPRLPTKESSYLRSQRQLPILRPLALTLKRDTPEMEIELKPGPSVFVSGTVLHEDGSPCVAAGVKCIVFEGGEFSFEVSNAQTNSSGEYSIECPAGSPVSCVVVDAVEVNGNLLRAFPVADSIFNRSNGAAAWNNLQHDVDGVDWEILSTPPKVPTVTFENLLLDRVKRFFGVDD